VSTWQAVRATEAESAARVAEDEAKTVRDLAVDAEKRAKEEAQKARAAEDEAKEERDRARDALLDMFSLGVSFQRVGQDEQALAVYLKALEASQRAGKWSEGPSLIYVGVFDFKRRGKYTEAERLLERLVQLYEEWREPAQAAAYRQELEAVRQLVKSAPAGAADVVDFPKGTFTLKGPDGAAWALKLDGQTKFTVYRSDEVGVEGTYKITMNEIDFTDEKGFLAETGAAKTGTYKWKLANGKLTFTRVTDEGARAAILTSGSWEKKE
jgi:tetratricopeptide (TPR) repeat protein